MAAATDGKQYIVVVQCHIVMERCSGFFCEKAFHDREGSFSAIPREASPRIIYLTCGGCCGRALQRKVENLMQKAKLKDGIEKDKILVQFASCITRDNFHGPPCPHLDYLKDLISKLGLAMAMDTHLSSRATKRRQEGVYKS